MHYYFHHISIRTVFTQFWYLHKFGDLNRDTLIKFSWISITTLQFRQALLSLSNLPPQSPPPFTPLFSLYFLDFWQETITKCQAQLADALKSLLDAKQVCSAGFPALAFTYSSGRTESEDKLITKDRENLLIAGEASRKPNKIRAQIVKSYRKTHTHAKEIITARMCVLSFDFFLQNLPLQFYQAEFTVRKNKKQFLTLTKIGHIDRKKRHPSTSQIQHQPNPSPPPQPQMEVHHWKHTMTPSLSEIFEKNSEAKCLKVTFILINIPVGKEN